jgi:hypothetical protein
MYSVDVHNGAAGDKTHVLSPAAPLCTSTVHQNTASTQEEKLKMRLLLVR